MINLDLTDHDLDGLLASLNPQRAVPLVLDLARRQALCGYDDVQACPGSGKTTLVGLKLLCLARKWTAARRGICVLTHTNVAKDEILKCLSLHPAGQPLNGYPHFIGTIQEFVNTFLSLPALRSEGMAVSHIDDDHCSTRLQHMAKIGTKTYLGNKNASLSDLRYTWKDGELKLVTPAFNKPSDSASYKDLLAIKEKLIGEGAFFYSEMYAFAEAALARSTGLADALRHRFPFVLIDEMQDVQGFQDTLISSIFRVPEVKFQRFGDPDQAIFDGVGGEMPNTSYNTVAMQPISESHRYCPGIAAQIRGLSSRKLPLTSSGAAMPGDPACTLILFGPATQNQVLQRFGELVQTLPVERRQIVKALGGVAENKADANNPLNISGYWGDYKRALQPQNFRPQTLCQAVRHMLGPGDTAPRTPRLIDVIIHVYRLAGIQFTSQAGKSKPPSRAGLPVHLRGLGTYASFRKLIASWILGPAPSPEQWPAEVQKLRTALGLTVATPAADALLAFDPQPVAAVPAAPEPGNIVTTQAGVRIELATIHSVKGETHDATLWMETKYNKLFDVKEMIPYLLDTALVAPVFDPAHPTTKQSVLASFMKKGYVAASRPKHLLSVAMGRERITQQQRAALEARGWSIIDLG